MRVIKFTFEASHIVILVVLWTIKFIIGLWVYERIILGLSKKCLSMNIVTLQLIQTFKIGVSEIARSQAIFPLESLHSKDHLSGTFLFGLSNIVQSRASHRFWHGSSNLAGGIIDLFE